MNKKKQFNLHTDLANNCFIVGNDCKFGMFDKLEREQCLRVIDKLNEQEEEIKRLKRHIERSTISRITVEDVLACARDSRFYDNEEVVKAIDCIAKDLRVNLY